MESILTTATGILIILCLLLMRRITKLEDDNFDLNEKLNLSDGEYVDLFNVNLELSEQIENFAKTRISESWYSDEIEKRMNIVGQNGNDGEHYEMPKIGTKEFNDLCSKFFGGNHSKK